MALEALSALRAFGGLGAGEAIWQKGRTVTKERQALNQYYEDQATQGRAGLKAARDVSKRQGLGRLIGGIGGGLLGFAVGGIGGATAGAGFGSKWGQEFGRKTGGGVGRITRGAERLGGAPEGLFLSGRRREAGESQKRLMEQLRGTVGAGREAVKGRALQDALTAFGMTGGWGKVADIAKGAINPVTGTPTGVGSLFAKPGGLEAVARPDIGMDMGLQEAEASLGQAFMPASGPGGLPIRKLGTAAYQSPASQISRRAFGGGMDDYLLSGQIGSNVRAQFGLGNFSSRMASQYPLVY